MAGIEKEFRVALGIGEESELLQLSSEFGGARNVPC